MASGRKSSTGIKHIIKMPNDTYRIQLKTGDDIVRRGPYATKEEAVVMLKQVMEEVFLYAENSKPYMAESEIKQRYRLAKDKGEMIRILADLNACSRQTILRIVEAKND